MNRTSKAFLVAGLLAVVGMAFRVSWNALRDVSHAIGADPTAAAVYPLVVDGLMALALIATLVLPDTTEGDPDKSPRGFALKVLAGYTAASLVLNYVHGLVPQIQDGGRVRLADWSPANWALVLLATSLPVGSIFFGSDLVAKVLHHKTTPLEPAQTPVKGSVSDLEQSADPIPVTSVYVTPDPTPTPALDTPAPVAEPPAEPVRVAAASAGRPRRATGTVPTAARSKRPTRTPSELLAEAKAVTADWPDARLTADHIREAVRTSSVNARALRDALRAERANRTGLHAVPDAAPTEVPAVEAAPADDDAPGVA
jgi:hypothetical protein